VAVNLATTVEKARQLGYLGGTYGGNQKPTPFLCLLLKLLQLGPSEADVKDLVQSGPKYALALALFYGRLVMTSAAVYALLEPFLLDYRKLRYRGIDGSYALMAMDELVERLLADELLFQVPLPHITKRCALVDLGRLPERASPLLDELLNSLDEE
jgi:pre-mRNA-splicing factor 38A